MILNATIGFGLVIFIACCSLFYFAITSKKFALIASAIGILMSFIPSFINIGQLNVEVKSRKSKYL